MRPPKMPRPPTIAVTGVSAIPKNPSEFGDWVERKAITEHYQNHWPDGTWIILRGGLCELADAGFDLGVIGFDPAELAGTRDVRPHRLDDPDDASPGGKPILALCVAICGAWGGIGCYVVFVRVRR
jgi:hypothetical protein